MSIELEIAYYKKHRSKLTSNKKYLVDLYGLNRYRRICRSTLATKVKPFKKYKKDVWKLTEKQPLHLLENFEKRGFKNYHVDHITSIFKAYKLGWLVEQCGDISNLQMLPYKENLKKHIK